MEFYFQFLLLYHLLENLIPAALSLSPIIDHVNLELTKSKNNNNPVSKGNKERPTCAAPFLMIE